MAAALFIAFLVVQRLAELAIARRNTARLLAQQTHELGKATVMVTHDERLLPVCDRVLVMHDGVLTEQHIAKDDEGQSDSQDDR